MSTPNASTVTLFFSGAHAMSTPNASTVTLFFYGIDPQTGERVEFEGTPDEAVTYATEHGVALDGCLSDDPETQAAQGVKFKVTAEGEWRWV